MVEGEEDRPVSCAVVVAVRLVACACMDTRVAQEAHQPSVRPQGYHPGRNWKQPRRGWLTPGTPIPRTREVEDRRPMMPGYILCAGSLSLYVSNSYLR